MTAAEKQLAERLAALIEVVKLMRGDDRNKILTWYQIGFDDAIKKAEAALKEAQTNN